MSRRSASRSASSSSQGDPFAEAAGGELKKGAVVTCEVTDVKEGGIEVKIAGTDLDDLHQALRSGARPRRAAPGAFRGRREGRCPRHPVRQEDPQGPGLDQGARNRRGEGGGRAVRLVRFRRVARRHSRRRAQARATRSRDAKRNPDRGRRATNLAQAPAFRRDSPQPAHFSHCIAHRRLQARFAPAMNRAARIDSRESAHVARCRPDRRSPPHAAQADLLARSRRDCRDRGAGRLRCRVRDAADRRRSPDRPGLDRAGQDQRI